MSYVFRYGDIERTLPIYEVNNGVKIAYLDTFCDLELVTALSAEMVEIIARNKEFRASDRVVILTAVSKGVPFAYTVGSELSKRFQGKKIQLAIARKERKKFFGKTVDVDKASITTVGRGDVLILAENDVNKLEGAKVILLDDMYSTGASLTALTELADKCNAEIIEKVVAVWETADESNTPPVHYVTVLPLAK